MSSRLLRCVCVCVCFNSTFGVVSSSLLVTVKMERFVQIIYYVGSNYRFRYGLRIKETYSFVTMNSLEIESCLRMSVDLIYRMTKI